MDARVGRRATYGDFDGMSEGLRVVDRITDIVLAYRRLKKKHKKAARKIEWRAVKISAIPSAPHAYR